jgi:hypothetical protein
LTLGCGLTYRKVGNAATWGGVLSGEKTEVKFKACAVVATALLGLTAAPAWAGYQTCNGKRIPDSARSCPDGSIPMFHADEMKPDPQPQGGGYGREDGYDRGGRGGRPAPSLFGVWRTSVPGAVWEGSADAAGYRRVHAAPGARAGDLVITPDGRYSWNSYGGKKGRWVRGDDPAYPIVLIDTVEHKRWKVGWDRDHLVIWDGSIWYFGRR